MCRVSLVAKDGKFCLLITMLPLLTPTVYEMSPTTAREKDIDKDDSLAGDPWGALGLAKH